MSVDPNAVMTYVTDLEIGDCVDLEECELVSLADRENVFAYEYAIVQSIDTSDADTITIHFDTTSVAFALDHRVPKAKVHLR